MAQIVINEISQNYSYNIGRASYATVALPITACWGPGYFDPDSYISDEATQDGSLSKESLMLESTAWSRFKATQDGLESFVSTFRGPASNYRVAQDYSYQMAMTLLASGYDVLVCRVCPGVKATTAFTIGGKQFNISAKYPGSFGNSLRVVLQKVANYNRWNIITYILNASGVQTAVENLTFVFELDNSSDTILHISELESNFLEFKADDGILDTADFETAAHILGDANDYKSAQIGTDMLPVAEGASAADIIGKETDSITDSSVSTAFKYALQRYTDANIEKPDYYSALSSLAKNIGDNVTKAIITRYNEWKYTAAYNVYDLLEDKLAYNPQRIISPGWDDQDINSLDDSVATKLKDISPLHLKLMEVAYFSRCATAYIDIPKSLARAYVYNESEKDPGYAQMLARFENSSANFDVNVAYYPSHSALFAPWGKYTYVGTGKQNEASPSFLALLIERAMILNQTSQYEWELPTTRRHNLKIGKMAYNVPKKLLDEWQSLEGVGVNVLTNIPDLGLSIWGNSTLVEVPPATYQALANLSTRKLVNAVEDLSYRCGIAITFQYSNDQAYNSFYAGMTPLLDTMKNVGAIEDYYLRMAEDVNGLDQVNANSVIGKVYLVVKGVINNITIDLIALPPQSNLDQYKA